MTSTNLDDWAIEPLPQTVDREWLARVLPGKDEHKRETWLKVLHDNEFEELEELAALDAAGWESLPLPLAVKSALRQAAQRPVDIVACTPKPDLPPPTQLDCIVIDISGSMRARSDLDIDKTREDVSKLLFHTSIDKLVSLELDHAVGLLGFGATITPIGITREYESFHNELGRLDANQSSTMLYDAIYDAALMLETYADQHPPKEGEKMPKKRVFVLTDGADNASKRLPWEVARFLQERNIVLDAIPLAGHNAVLQSMTRATGGLFLDVVSQEQGMALFEREAVLHIGFREEVPANPLIESAAGLANLECGVAPVRDVKSAVSAAVHAPVLQAAAVTKRAEADGDPAVVKRVLREYMRLTKDPVEGWTSYVGAEDLLGWKAVLSGPVGTSYEGGAWLVTLSFPAQFPFKPPQLRFETPIYHCNISNDGRVCLDILRDAWTPACTVAHLFLGVSELLRHPNADDPLDAYKGQLARDDRAAYETAVRQHTKDHAGASADALAATYNLA